MTRLEFKDLPPNIKKQVLIQMAKEDAEKKKKLENISNDFSEKPKKQSKYKAQKTEVQLADGTLHTFDSRKEARCYKELELRLKAGEISNLRMQVPYELVPTQRLSNGKAERSVKYLADFVYEEDGKTVVVDAKGMRTDVYIIKRKLMKWIHNIEIKEM